MSKTIDKIKESLKWLEGLEESYQVSLDQQEYAQDYLFHHIAMIYLTRTLMRELEVTDITVSKRDIQGWASEAQDRVEADRHWGNVEDVMKEMLTDIGVSVA